MKLVSLRLKNFRCYQNAFLSFSDLTALVGRNDVGKSTILEALDIFFNDGVPDKHDATKGGNPQQLSISCSFEDHPDELVLDEDAASTLTTEFLLNASGQLEIEKVFNGSLEKPKLTEQFAFARHPTAEGAADLLQLSNVQLKKRAADLGVNLDGVVRTRNSALRSAIRSHLGELALDQVKVPLMDGNGAKVWRGLQAAFPVFALFRADRASTDQDPEAQDPLLSAVKEALRQKEAELNAIVEHVEGEVRKIADLTLLKVHELDPNLAAELNPHIQAPKWASQFKASITGDNDIALNKRGSGVRRLVLLSFFRAKAERSASDGNQIIYAIEEPETSQHPRNQRMLLGALQQLSGNCQVIITTHTPMLARSLPDTSIRYITASTEGVRTISEGGSDAVNRQIADSLGVLPDHSIKALIALEGPTDISFLRTLSKVLVEEGCTVPDLERLELDGYLMFIPLGGSTIGYWSHRMEGLNREEFHLCDRDTAPPAPANYQAHIETVNLRDGCVAMATNRRAIENYLHVDAINEGLDQLRIPASLVAPPGPFDDVPATLVPLVNGVVPSSNKWNKSRAKAFLCDIAVQKMTRERLQEVDPDGEVLGWFKVIGEMIHRFDSR